jgi:phenylalanyl-tRNA synthetase beta chain
VMGGFDTEIGDGTTNVLIEVAEFAPMSVRATARRLLLHSDSSYRFERGVDRYNLEWAARRCAHLILELAGGELCAGTVYAGTAPPAQRAPVTLRYSQIPRILGIEISREETGRILRTLGLEEVKSSATDSCTFVPPTWRRDLTREADLIEEVARVHGYEKIPEDVVVPLEVSTRTSRDRLIERCTAPLLATGFFEAITLTFVSEELARSFHPWGDAPPLKVEHSTRQKENALRQSLIPSLLAVRRQNERHGTFNAQLFEVAKAYLRAEPGNPEAEPALLSFVSGRSFAELKGVVESVVDAASHAARLSVRPATVAGFTEGRGCELLLNGKRLGWLGEIHDDLRKEFDLHDSVTAAELDLSVLETVADFEPKYHPIPEYPAMDRDLNFVLDESVSWHELENVVRDAAGALLESVAFGSQYRGPQIPPDKKSYVAHLKYRSADRTLTADEVDAAQARVIAACQTRLQAQLRA